ncbi:MAG: hypothetical protein CVV32_01750 [Methanomicrobiales archaeon HGW-Methanomicrobiales-3]|jgi:hypothetical protein|nr:MAG: hypothetical protein CVV32_01750 [Methanomicrobiales archaeon HGW-Methanomicrobiales-3]
MGGMKDIFITSSLEGTIMEPLENRIARLTTEQQKEVMDFVDFLLVKNTLKQGPANPIPAPIRGTSPPVLVSDIPCTQSRDCPVEPDSWSLNNPHSCAPHGEPTPPVIHEIGGGSDDTITREYLDYGSFTMVAPPEKEMQRKGRPQVIAREGKENTRHILEWVE